MNAPIEGIFTGGQMTDLPAYPSLTFDGTELFETVAPGNAALGINYSVSSFLLSSLLLTINYTPVIITSGATSISPYDVVTTTSRVLFNKTVGAASYAVLGLARNQPLPVLFKDIKGDAGSNPITITMSGGETADGLTSVTINNPYGGIWFNPLAAGNWYLTGA